MRNKIVIFILILGLALGIAGFYYYQKNVYSKEVLRLEILGPSESQAFEEVEYLVKYKNNGNVVLEEAQLTFQYPENSIAAGEEGQSNNRVVKPLEDIYPGEEKTISFKGRLVGQEGASTKAEAQLRYRPKNLKAFFESSTTFTSRIESLPLTFEVDLPSRVEAGKELQFFLNYFSNSEWPLSDLRVKIEYPSGFEFVSSRPEALDKTEWNLPILNKTEGGRIEIKGKLSGEVKEQKVFRGTIGFWRQGEFILLKDVSRGAEILRPSLSVFQQVNNYVDYVASAGDVLHYEIFFRNIGEEPFQDMFLVSKLDSPAFDFDTLRTNVGKHNKGDNFIIWDWREVPRLRFLEGGEEGKVEFWINLKDSWEALAESKNFSLKNEVSVSQVREIFETKINSKLELSQKADFQDEAFGNTGPNPPRAGETTTYTILWQAKNYYNDVKDAKVKAVLPSNVRLTGKIFPEDAPLTFDSASREVVWSLGDIEARAGVTKSAPLVAFQVALTPSSNQRGQAAQIVLEALISGQDDWTGARLEATAAPVLSDPVQ